MHTSLRPEPDSQSEYRRYIKRKWLALLAIFLVMAAMALVAVSVGSAGISLGETVMALLGRGSPQSRTIIWNLRMPRIAVGIGVGIALSLTGCIMQNVLRNPLASASTLGVMQGAAFGAAVAIVYFGAGVQAVGAVGALTITNPYMVAICAFLGGMATTAVILALSRVGGVTPSVMILAGVALSSLFTGATILVQHFADDTAVAATVYWTFGSLGRAGWNEIALIYMLCAAVFVFFILNRWNYNAMESGLHTAKSLGVPVGALIVSSLVAGALVSSVAVAFVGSIGFIGLIAPHIARRFVGNDYRFLIPCSALTGASLMLAADIVSRMLIPPAVLPIGGVTSFLGAPLFLYMIIKKGNII